MIKGYVCNQITDLMIELDSVKGKCVGDTLVIDLDGYEPDEGDVITLVVRVP